MPCLLLLLQIIVWRMVSRLYCNVTFLVGPFPDDLLIIAPFSIHFSTFCSPIGLKITKQAIFYSFVCCLVRMYTLKVRIFGFVYHFSPLPTEVFDVYNVLSNIYAVNKLEPMGRSTQQQTTIVTWMKGWSYFNVSSLKRHRGDTFTLQS